MKSIEGFDGYYITECGFVISNKRKNAIVLKPKISKDGYEAVCLVKGGKNYHRRVHRLVADAFVYNTNDKHIVVNHIDGNKLNNKSNNLEWTSIQGNTLHAVKTGLMTHHMDNLDKMNEINKKKVINLDTLEIFDSVTLAGLQYKCDPSCVSKVCKGKFKHTKGNRFAYYAEVMPNVHYTKIG
jgi:hypothetical protein